MMEALVSAAHWFKRRDEEMNQARLCLETLTSRDGEWRYSQDDQRVKNAVSVWVSRARRAHNVAMGREPIIPSLTIITNDSYASGSLYAGKRPVITNPQTYADVGAPL